MVHVTRMSQVLDPIRVLDHFVGKVRRTTARFDGSMNHNTIGYHLADSLPRVGPRSVDKLLAVFIQDTILNGVLVIIQADEDLWW